MAVIALLAILGGVGAAAYFFRASSKEANEAKARLQIDIEARIAGGLGAPHVTEPRRFGTDEEKNRAEAVPFFAPNPPEFEVVEATDEKQQPSLFD